jgi:kynurenine formamidase
VIRIDRARAIDLSQPIGHDGPAWAEYDPPTITHSFRLAAEGFNAETVRMNTHTGTHVDVPYHFDDAGETVDQRPLEACAVGIDALSIGGWGGPEKGEPSHHALLRAGALIIDELRIPEAVLTAERFFLAAVPVLLQGCGGAWTRAVAWPLEEEG